MPLQGDITLAVPPLPSGRPCRYGIVKLTETQPNSSLSGGV